jgi:hypothetical protein
MYEPPTRQTSTPAYVPPPVSPGTPAPPPYAPPAAAPDAATAYPAPRRRRAWPWILGAAAAAVVLVGVSLAVLATRPDPKPAAATPPPTLTITGEIVLTQGQFVWDANPPTCGGYRGYDDIALGASVTVTDPSGKVVGATRLSRATPQVDPADAQRAVGCTLSFQVINVPAGLGFYGVEVSHRGVVQRRESELTNIQLGF